VVFCLEQGADLHTAQLMPLPLTLSCFSIIQISFTFLVQAHLGSPDKGPLNGCTSCTFVLHVCAQYPRAANKSLIVTIRKYAVNRFYPPDALLVWVLAMALCLCLSQVSVLLKQLNKSGCFLAWELLTTYPTLFCKEIELPLKIRVLPSGTLLQTLDLENLATTYRSSKCVINLARERWTLRA